MKRMTWAAIVAVVAVLVTGCEPKSQDQAPAPESTVSATPLAQPEVPDAEETSSAVEVSDQPAAPTNDVMALVNSLEVKGRAPKTGYSREEFGAAWSDVDRNGCDTRNDILNRDLINKTYKSGTHDCVVLTGVLNDLYSGESIQFERGPNSSDVQIDHVIALSDAWQKGAQSWDAATREKFANDPLNLIASQGRLNSQKGDGDTATWLPPNSAFRCHYVARQVTVKATYGLWVTQAEKDAMVSVLSNCSAEAVSFDPYASASFQTSDSAEVAPAPVEPVVPVTPAEPGPEASGANTDPQFGSCAEAKAAGYGPYVNGQDTEYTWYRDGDGDGTVCE